MASKLNVFGRSLSIGSFTKSTRSFTKSKEERGYQTLFVVDECQSTRSPSASLELIINERTGDLRLRRRYRRSSRPGSNQTKVFNVKHIHIVIEANEFKESVSLRLIIEWTSSMKTVGTLTPRHRHQSPWDLLFKSPAHRSRCIFLLNLISERLFGRSLCTESLSICRPVEWISDSLVHCCPICGDHFNAMIRKHHCRRCGNVLCHQCSSERAVLPDLGIRDCVRVCSLCYDLVIRETLKSDGLLNVDELHQIDIDSASSTTNHSNYGLNGTVNGTFSLNQNFRINHRVNVSTLIPPKWQRMMAQHSRSQHSRFGTMDSSDPAQDECAELIRSGIPSALRGYVWTLQAPFQKLRGHQRSKRTHSKSVPHSAPEPVPESFPKSVPESASESIHLSEEETYSMEADLQRTLPIHPIFGEKSSTSTLRRLLLRFAANHKEIGYCQSMNFLGAILLLFLCEEDAYWMMVHLLGSESICRPLGRHYYHQRDLLGVHLDGLVAADLVRQCLPDLDRHLLSLRPPESETDSHSESNRNLISNLTVHWFLGLMVGPLSMRPLLRIWDRMICGEGIFIIFRAALSILKLQSDALLRCKEMGQIHHLLSNEVLLKSDRIQNEELLFRNCHCSDFKDLDQMVMTQRAFHGKYLEKDDEDIAAHFYRDQTLKVINEYTAKHHHHQNDNDNEIGDFMLFGPSKSDRKSNRSQSGWPSPPPPALSGPLSALRPTPISLQSPRRSLSNHNDEAAAITKEFRTGNGMNLNHSEMDGVESVISVESIESELELNDNGNGNGNGTEYDIMSPSPSPSSSPPQRISSIRLKPMMANKRRTGSMSWLTRKRTKLKQRSKSENLIESENENDFGNDVGHNLNSSPFQSTLLMSKSFHRDLSANDNQRAWSLDGDPILIATSPDRAPFQDDFVRIDSVGNTVK